MVLSWQNVHSETAMGASSSLAGLTTTKLERRAVLDEISVVIPTLGRAILESGLFHLASGNTWPAEIIVVDQGTNTSTGQWVEQLQAVGLKATLITSSQRGRSAGINRGLEHVRTRFVAVTDDDCLVAADWLQNMLNQLRTFPDSIITGRVDPAGDTDVEFCVVPSQVPTVYRRPQLKAQPLIGGNMGVAMENVHRIGPFDEHVCLHSAEDSDWGYRALRQGISIRYVPEIVVQHFNWRSTEQRARRYREYSRSQGGFYGKHLLSGDGIIWLQVARDLVRGPIRWLRGGLRRDHDMIDRGRADSLDLLPGILGGMRHARELRAAHRTSHVRGIARNEP